MALRFKTAPTAVLVVLLLTVYLICLPADVPAGYMYPVDDVLDELVLCLDSPGLPLLQWNEEFSFIENRLPSGLPLRLNAITKEHEEALNDRGSLEFPGRALIRIMREVVEVS